MENLITLILLTIVLFMIVYISAKFYIIDEDKKFFGHHHKYIETDKCYKAIHDEIIIYKVLKCKKCKNLKFQEINSVLYNENRIKQLKELGFINLDDYKFQEILKTK